MLTIETTSRFRKDFRAAMKRGCDRKAFEAVVEKLASRRPLPAKYRDHALTGNWEGFRECHIQPDWLLIYYVDGKELVLTLIRTGSHAALLGK